MAGKKMQSRLVSEPIVYKDDSLAKEVMAGNLTAAEEQWVKDGSKGALTMPIEVMTAHFARELKAARGTIAAVEEQAIYGFTGLEQR